MDERRARIASVVAATGIALACGTNYAYSAWGPDFAKRMDLSATQGNVIGAAGNVGAYAMGVPAGILIDSRGTRTGVLVGAVLLACGYFPLHAAYDRGSGSVNVSILSFLAFLTGTGSCTAFSAAIKTSAFNWPSHRGTATAFPVSGFGLSAFFFTTLGNIFGSGASDFLWLLAVGTLVLNGSSFFFLRLIPTAETPPVAETEEGLPNSAHTSHSKSGSMSKMSTEREPLRMGELDHRLSNVSEIGRGDFAKPGYDPMQHREITGIKLLFEYEFWQLFFMLSLLAGVGLMTINNIGNDVGALMRKFDPKAPEAEVSAKEKLHVGILSLGSFGGRFVSGIGSDILIKKLHASRFWCLFFSACTFIIAQSFALIVSDPNWMFLVSGLTGLGYGALFGVFPALTADAFGVQGLSLNWGFMIFAPVISGNIFNLFYGHVLDSNTPSGPGGGKKEGPGAGKHPGECMKGINCYVSAYWLTLLSSCLGAVGALWCIKYEGMKRRRFSLGREA